MAGVAGPMLKRSTAEGTRFLLGLLFGEVAAAALMSVLVHLLGEGMSLIVPEAVRATVAGVLVAGLGAADLAGRTPHIWRQVPQGLVRTTPPGTLGLVWGFDLGLLFTTQKSTSLTWAALAAALLLTPSSGAVLLVGMAVVGVLAVAARSVAWDLVGVSEFGDRVRPWFGWMRRGAGAALLVVGALTVWGAW